MKSYVKFGTFALGIMTALAAVPAGSIAAPAPANPVLAGAVDGGLTEVGYRRHRHYHHAGRHYRYSAPGFNDPGHAYRGNINGCSVDLGYGRYEPCNKGR